MRPAHDRQGSTAAQRREDPFRPNLREAATSSFVRDGDGIPFRPQVAFRFRRLLRHTPAKDTLG